MANLPVSVSYTNDLNGNLTNDGLRTFTYDDENRLIQVEVANAYRSVFTYDGLGRRRVRDEYVWFNNAWAYTAYVFYIYDRQLVVDERWAGGEPPVHYTRGLDLSGTLAGAGGIGGLLARSQDVSAAPQHHYYHSDGSGNVTALINASQQVTAKYLYDPFGNILGMSGWMTDANLCRFSSKEVHPNSGLVFFGNRFYDPSLQRWLNTDPGGIADGPNLYAYVHNGPPNAVDAWGLNSDWIPDWVTFFLNSYPTGAPTYMSPAGVLMTQPPSNSVESSLMYINMGGYDPSQLHAIASAIEMAADINPISGAFNATYTATTGKDAINHQSVDSGTRLQAISASVSMILPILGRASRIAGGVWELGPTERGRKIEQAFGKNLPDAFPVIDDFRGGLATSIKSIDLTAISYQDPKSLLSVLQGYIDKVAAFKGDKYAGYAVDKSLVKSRQLLLVVPPDSISLAQTAALIAAEKYAQK